MIRENQLIRGINNNGTEHKIAQFADDTQMMTEGDQVIIVSNMDKKINNPIRKSSSVKITYFVQNISVMDVVTKPTN